MKNPNVLTAFEAATKLLTARDRTSAELRSRLVRKGFASTAVEQAVVRAIELGYLDDTRTAKALAERWFAAGAPRALVDQKLRDAGTPTALAEAILRTAPPERTQAQIALHRRFGERIPTPQKAARFLAGRGFDPDLIGELLGGLSEGRLGD